MRALGSLRPPEADLTHQIVDDRERERLIDSIVSHRGVLPPRLEQIRVREHRGHRLAVTGVAAVLVAVIAVVVLVAGSGDGRSVEQAQSRAPDAVTLQQVAVRVPAAVGAAGHALQLRMSISVGSGADASRLVEVVQSPDGSTTRIDEHAPDGSLAKSTLLTRVGTTTTTRVVDSEARTWSERQSIDPDSGVGSGRGVVFLLDGASASQLGVGWIGDADALRVLLGNDTLTVRRDGAATLVLTGPLAPFASAGQLPAHLESIAAYTDVTMWVNASTYLPERLRLESPDGRTSDARVRWVEGAAPTLGVPEGFVRR